MWPVSQKGQSLVEMAITAPILIFMLIGVFEVGWALRGYLVLTNVNREITRFAIRPGYLDYTLKNPTITAATTVGYDKVLSYTYTTLADQLPLDFSTGQTSTLIVSHLVVDTGLACKPGQNCNCNQFVSDPNYYLNGTDVLTYDDLILHPQTPGYNYYYVYTFPLTSPYRTQLNYPAMAAQMARENNKFNCELLKKSTGTIPSANNVIVTELYYNQPQLFGFPIIANPYTDPVPMYTHTTMRMIVASRSSDENTDTVGPVCIAAPFTIKNTRIATATVGSTVLDILGGEAPAGTSDRGFLGWDPNWNQADELRTELLYPRTSFNSYTNARDSSDHTLSVGDYVNSLNGNTAGVEPQIEALARQGGTVIIPVFDDFSPPSPPALEGAFRISTFIRVRILVDPPFTMNLSSSSGGPTVWGIYEGIATECLQ
jgi:Flp pilus assembly protein TadG